MKLQDFISETLRAVVSGVRDAQESAEELGAKINPYHGSSSAIQQIEFDVEVATQDGTTTKSGLGVFVGPIGAGTQAGSAETTRTVGRIRFSVPVALPSHPRKGRE